MPPVGGIPQRRTPLPFPVYIVIIAHNGYKTGYKSQDDLQIFPSCSTKFEAQICASCLIFPVGPPSSPPVPGRAPKGSRYACEGITAKIRIFGLPHYKHIIAQEGYKTGYKWQFLFHIFPSISIKFTGCFWLFCRIRQVRSRKVDASILIVIHFITPGEKIQYI